MGKTTNIFIRIEPEDKALLEQGAQLDRRSLSDFVRLAALDRADNLIDNAKRRRSRSTSR